MPVTAWKSNVDVVGKTNKTLQFIVLQLLHLFISHCDRELHKNSKNTIKTVMEDNLKASPSLPPNWESQVSKVSLSFPVVNMAWKAVHV